MTIGELIDTLQRPVDHINVGTGYDEYRNELYTYDGLEVFNENDNEVIPEPIKDLTVEKWEVEAEVAQKSLCELEIFYNLVITI